MIGFFLAEFGDRFGCPARHRLRLFDLALLD